MSGVHNKADDITKAISTGTCYIVLERFPPDYVQTVARYLESSVQQNNCDATRDDPKETESDSGDSVFITQKPVSEPVRTRRRHRKTPTSPKDLEESEDSSSSQNATTSNKKRKRKNVRLPTYSFPFVKEKQWMGRRSVLTGQQNKSLHNAMMGGFFKCVRELWHGYKGVYMDMSLPTVDMDGDIISPLSEEEEERSEEEDIKVVEKRFLAASKAMCTQAWYTPGKMEGHIKQQSRRRRASSTSQDVSQDQTMTIKRSTSRSITTATPLLSDKDGHPCRDLPQQENGDHEHEIHQKSIPGQTEMSKTKRRLTGGKKMILFQKNEREEELCSDSDATVCDALQLHGSPSKHTQGGKQAVNTATQAQVDVFQMDELSQTRQEEEEPESQSVLQSLPQFVGDTNNVIVCAESTPKNKKKNTVTQAQADVFQMDELSQTRKEEEEPESQSVLQGLPQFVGDTNNVIVCAESTPKKKKKKKKNTVTQAQADVFQIDELSQTRQEEEEPESQSVLQGLPQFVGDTNNVTVFAESTLKKKKKNTVTQAQADVFQMDELSQTRQEEEEPESQSVLQGLPQFVGDTNNVIVCAESTPKKKKKKKKNTVTQAQADVFQIDELSQTRQEEEEPESQSVLQGLPQFVGDTNNVTVFAESTLKKKKKNTVTQAQADVFQMDELSQTRQEEEEPESQSLLQSLPQFVSDANNVIVCAESTPKKKKKKKKNKNKNKKAKGDCDSVEEAAGQSQEEPEGLHAAESVNVEAEETFSRSDNNDNMSMQEKRLDSTQQKRKRKRGKLIAENIRQEVGEHLEPGVILEESEASVMCNIENAKKIKKKKGVDDAEGVEQLESTEAATTKNDGQKKMKKLKHKSIKRSSSLEDNQCGNDAKVRLSNEGATLEERVVKKRKKESISQGVSISYTPDKSDEVEYIDSNEQDEQLCKKKKKKRRREKFGELSNEQASKDTVAQSDEAVSVRKKEKRTTSSFLQADSGEKDVELHQQQNNSKTVAPGVCDFEAESAEIAGNSGDGVSKKKKKKRKTLETQDNVEEDQGTEFEEPNKMCRSVLTETGIKRKKKSKSVSMDRLDSAVDGGRFQAEEDMMQKKKKNKKIFKELKI